MAEEDLVVIPLPLDEGGQWPSWSTGGEDPHAEIIVAVPGTSAQPSKRIALSR